MISQKEYNKIKITSYELKLFDLLIKTLNKRPYIDTYGLIYFIKPFIKNRIIKDNYIESIFLDRNKIYFKIKGKRPFLTDFHKDTFPIILDLNKCIDYNKVELFLLEE